MAVLYTTIEKEAHVEQVIERSRFIAHAKPVSSKEEADAFVAAIKSKYKDATHNVPAMVIGDKMQLQWGSDDGEPQGTSGAPVVQMLVKEGLTNLVVVVKRYFGGIKLGTGGLVRAYTGSAKMAVEEAGRFDVKEYVKLQVLIPYSDYDRVRYLSESEPFKIISSSFTDSVALEIEYEKDDEKTVKNIFQDILKKS